MADLVGYLDVYGFDECKINNPDLMKLLYKKATKSDDTSDYDDVIYEVGEYVDDCLNESGMSSFSNNKLGKLLQKNNFSYAIRCFGENSMSNIMGPASIVIDNYDPKSGDHDILEADTDADCDPCSNLYIVKRAEGCFAKYKPLIGYDVDFYSTIANKLHDSNPDMPVIEDWINDICHLKEMSLDCLSADEQLAIELQTALNVDASDNESGEKDFMLEYYAA